MKRIFVSFLLILMFLSASGQAVAAQENPADYLALPLQKTSLTYLSDIGGGRLYRLDYASDYKLDALLEGGKLDLGSLLSFVQEELLNGAPPIESYEFSGNGLSFSAESELDAPLLCHNYNGMSGGPLVMLNTTTYAGYVSIGLADAGILGYGIGSLSDGSTDLSLTMALPYLVMDGINETGLGVSLLGPTPALAEEDSAIFYGIAIRLILDRAASIDEAAALLEESISPYAGAGFRLFLAEGESGRSAIIHCDVNGVRIADASYGAMDGPVEGSSEYGQYYSAMMEILAEPIYEQDAFPILERLRMQEEEASPISTQWSVTYDLRRLNVSIVSDEDYKKIYHMVFINDASC